MESQSSLKEKSPTSSELDGQFKIDIQTTSGINEGNSANEESVGSNLESETQHMSICDRKVNYEDIIDMADKINRSPSEKFSIEFCDCDLTTEHLKCFCEEIKDAHSQITTLALTYMKNVDDLLEKTCFIVWKYRTTNLSLEYDAISDKSIGIIRDYLEDKPIETLSLDISYNSGISAAGFANLGRIMNKLKTFSLEATDCDITDEKLRAFLNMLQDVKLQRLNIGHNRNLSNEGFKALAEFVVKKGIESLQLSGCNISKEILDVFNECLLETGQKILIKELDVSYNATMEPNNSLGSVVNKCGVTDINVAGCKLSKEHLVRFRESVKKHEMNLVDMSDNVSIGPYLEELAALVIQCQIRELNVGDCIFSAQELKSFRTSLHGTKVSCLHLGDPELEPDKKYVDELCALLENVEDVLYLNFHKLGREFRTPLQKNCRNPVHIELTVDGKKEKISGNKSSAVAAGEQSVNQESSTLIQIEKPGPSSVIHIEKPNPSTSIQVEKPGPSNIIQPRPSLESEESFGNNVESETQHIWIRDHAVNQEDIIDMANKINSSSSKKFFIEFCDCDLTTDHLKCFCEKIKDAHCQITTLALTYMRNIDDLLETTCFIVWKYRTTNLSLECDAMNDKSIGILRDYLKDKPIETLTLDISYNSDISAAGFENLGRIMNKLKFVSLEATDCDITDEKLKAFLDAVQDVKLQGLNIGHNRNLTNEGFKALAEFVTNKGIESLQLSGCNISKETLDVFDEHLLQTEQKILIKDLDVSYNSTMEPNTSLGSVVYKCGVSSLSMAGCKLSKDHLISFRESVKNHEMNSLNIGDNVFIGPNLEELAALVIQCQVKELNIGDCIFSAQELENFRTSLNGAKMNCLHLGDPELDPGEKYIDELCALLENVEDVLYLQFHKLGDEFRTSLQKYCRNPAHIELTVDGKKEKISENKSPVKDGEQSVGQESSTFIQIEKAGPSTFLQIKEPRPVSESEEYFGSNLDSETEHIWIRDREVNHEDIIAMADKINSSSSEKFSIEFCDCDLTIDHLKYFCEKIKDAHCQITTLALTYMRNIDDLLEKTCFIVWKYRTTNLSLECDAMNDKSIGIIRDYLKDKPIETLHLDISYNSDISATGFEKLGKIMSKLKIISLEATDCDITDEKLQAFLNALQDVKLQRLNIGHNRNLTNEGFKALAEFVANNGIDSLQLSGCNISKEILDVFNEHLLQSGQKFLIKELDVSYNSTMEPNTSLGSVVYKCGVSNLSMAGCKLTKDHLISFRKSVKNHEMHSLNIGDNVSIGPCLEELATLVIQCQIKELNISDCMFSAQELESFRISLDGAKMNCLHLGDAELEPDKKYVDELCALFENVEHLYLQFHKLGNEFRTSLQKNCRNPAHIELTVDGKKEKISENKSSPVEVGEQSVDQESSTFIQIEKPGPSTFVQIEEPRPASESREYFGSNLESETEHVWMRDRAVNHEDIIAMADKINSSASEKFSIEFCDCDLTIDHLKYFCEKIKDAHFQVTTLALTYMRNIDDLLEKTCFIVWKYRTTNLSLECDAMNDKSIGIIRDYLKDKPIETLRLDISYNGDISAAGFENLGRIMNKLKFVSLEATDCDITDEKLQAFLNTLQDVKLQGLNIGHNRNLTNEGFKALAEFVTNKGIDSLRLSGCNISKEVLDVFNLHLLQTEQKILIKELDVSYNSTIEPNTSLGSMVSKCGVTNLNMAGCKLSKDHLVRFREAVKNHEMTLVNMSDNVSIGPCLEELATLVIQCQVKELNISDCMFSAQELENFRTTFNGAKISRIHLGDPEMEPDKKYVNELCTLLENVGDVLYLYFHKLSDNFRTSLRNNCRNFAQIELSVDGKKEEICGNKCIAIKADEQSMDRGLSTSTQVEKPASRSEGEDDFVDSSEVYSSTLLKTRKSKPQNQEQQTIGSKKEMLQEYIPNLQNKSSSTGAAHENETETIWIFPKPAKEYDKKKTSNTIESTETMLQEYPSSSENMPTSTEDNQPASKFILLMEMNDEHGNETKKILTSPKLAKEYDKEKTSNTIELTEGMLQEYSSSLEDMSTSTEYIEVVFKSEIIKIFDEVDDFVEFAESKKGLNLNTLSIQSIINEGGIKIDESKKMAILQLWREKNELLAVNIRDIVKRYFDIENSGIIHFGNGRVRLFNSQHRRPIRNIGEISTTTGYQFCAIQTSKDTKVLEAVTKLLAKKHENVVTVFQAGTCSEDPIYVATELAWTTSLQDNFSKNPFHEPTALNLAKQVLLALEFIHSHDIIFGNMNSRNAMVSDDGKQLILSDFRKSFCDSLAVGYRHRIRLPLPEVTECKESDIFSAGIVLAEIFSHGIHPYHDDDLEKITYNICNSIYLDLSNLQLHNKKEAKEVITYMLDPDPENRPTAVQALSDITFIQYPFKAPDDEQDPIVIRSKKSTNHGEEITQWTLDKAGNLTMLGESRIKNTVAEHPVESVIIYDRKVTESDIPTTSDEESKEYVFEFWGCDITADFLQLFYEKMDSKHRITRFKIAYMKPGKVSDLIEMICCIVIKWEIRSLSLEYNYLKDDDIDLLQKGFRKSKSEKFHSIELDISYNKDITSAGFRKLGEIKRDIDIYSLLVTACDVTDDKLEEFIKGLEDYRLSHYFLAEKYFKPLDLSCNPKLTARGYKSLAKHLSNHRVKHLKLRACEITEEIIDEFCYHLRGPLTKMISLDLSYNPGVTMNDSLLSIISETEMFELNLSGCEFRYKQSVHLTELPFQPQSSVLKTLCLRDNSTISGGLDGIAKLVKDLKLRELDIADCMLSASDLRAFREGLKETKLKCLHLGDMMRELDVPYMEEIVNVLPSVIETLYLELRKPNSDFLELLTKPTGMCSKVLMKFSDGSTQEWKKCGKYEALRLLKGM